MEICLIELKVRHVANTLSLLGYDKILVLSMLGRTPEVPASSWTAVTVIDDGSKQMFCPFFGKCDGVLLIDSNTGSRKILRNECHTVESFCQLVMKARPSRLICGFVGEVEKRKLRTAGIDVRLGSFACSLDELVACFCDLPAA